MKDTALEGAAFQAGAFQMDAFQIGRLSVELDEMGDAAAVAVLGKNVDVMNLAAEVLAFWEKEII
ncbi:MAG: hypothetical protein WCG85_00010 [Polyangia bacterium]